MADTIGDVLVGVVWLTAGGLLLRRREHRRIGLLIAATGLTWLLGSIVTELALLHRGPLAHVLLAYPGLSLAGPLELVIVSAAYLEGAVLGVGATAAVALALAVALLGAAVWRFLHETGVVRRSRAAPTLATVLVAAVLVVSATARLEGSVLGRWLSLSYDGVLIATAVILFADLRAGRWGRTAVEGLVVDLGGSGSLSRTLAHAIGDPSLEIAFTLDAGMTFVDEAGRPMSVTPPDSSRAATPVPERGRPIAVLMHEPDALRDPELLDGTRAAVVLAVANARLQADVRRHLDDVAASRRRLLHASDVQRRELAEELDSAVMTRLEAAERFLDSDDEQLEQQLAMARLRLQRLVRGLRPSELEERGLAGALPELAAASSLPVSVEVPRVRLDEDVERAAWFVCSEALANVVKHAQASRAAIHVAVTRGHLVIEVADDGVGGADPSRGSGLRGLASRVESIGGTLAVGDGSNGGTRVVAELPHSLPVGGHA